MTNLSLRLLPTFEKRLLAYLFDKISANKYFVTKDVTSRKSNYAEYPFVSKLIIVE